MNNGRRIIAYLQATNNEIALDEHAYKMLDIEPIDYGYLPRPTKSLKKVKITSVGIQNTIVFTWKYLFFYCIIFFQFCRGVGRSFQLKIYPENLNKKNIAVAFSERALEVITERNINKPIDAWILFPWVSSEKRDRKIQPIDIFSLINFGELVTAFRLSISAHIKLYRSKKYIHWTMQSYTSFQWFLVRLALEKICANFYIAEHFDRWAVMMDSICRDQEIIDRKSNYSLIQHGLVGDISIRGKLILPNRLTRLKELFVYDMESERYFRENILDEKVSRFLKNVTIYKHTLDLKDIDNSKEKSVLFVGNPICEDLHIFLFNYLKNNFSLKVYYKPHPLNGSSIAVKNLGWEIIKDKEFFPRVNLLISYPSTLEMEYKALGVSTLVHPIDLRTDDAKDFLVHIDDVLMML